MNAIYLIQSGTTGPVKIGSTPLANLEARHLIMQTGNPEILYIRALYAGDRAAEAGLHAQHDRHAVRADWYDPAILAEPCDLPAIPYDYEGQERDVAAQALRELARGARA